MKNYIEAGTTILAVVANTFHSGDVVQLGANDASAPSLGLTGVCSNDSDGVNAIAISLKGVFQVAKHTGEAFGVGDVLYWDATNKRCTASTNSSANFFCGYAHVAALSADTVVNLLLPK